MTQHPLLDSTLLVLDSLQSEVPDHLRVPFLSTVQDNHLPDHMAIGLKDLFIEHADTFATGPTGFWYIPQYDIDTGDTFLLNSHHAVLL